MLKLVVVALCAFAFTVGADVDPKRVHVIDYRSKTTNGGASLIFRGNTPVSDDGTSLNYTAWYSAMATNSYAQIGLQIAPPAQVYILDISLEDPYLDYQFPEEVAFWNNTANTAKGKFVNWQLYGSMNFPPDFTPTQQDAMARNTSLWAIDHLPERVVAIRELMVQGPPAGYAQLLIYLHCTHGQDRTGEFANAYRLAYHSSIEDGNRLSKAMSTKRVAAKHARENNLRKELEHGNPLLGLTPPGVSRGSIPNNGRSLRNRKGDENHIVPPPNPRGHVRNFHDSMERRNAKAARPVANIVNNHQSDDLTTMGAIYALGCQEGLRCPMYTFTANAGWFCLWSNVINGTSYGDCSTAYSCVPLLFCDATNV